MTMTKENLVLILVAGLVTILPRVLPFIFVKKMTIPDVVKKWLSYIPICILTAFFVQTLFINENKTLSLNIEQIIVVLPTLIVALYTKSLAKTVVFGVICMALVRYFIM